LWDLIEKPHTSTAAKASDNRISAPFPSGWPDEFVKKIAQNVAQSISSQN
jgi:hypothetical protein